MKNFYILVYILCSGFNAIASYPSPSHVDRSDRGVVISEAERQKATDEFISLLKDTQYFDFIDSRIHGIPEGNSNQTFWWATLWTGITVTKLNGQVTYTHNNQGTDNSGIFTSPYLESACYAYLLTGDPKYAHLSRRLMRGFSSWILGTARTSNEKPKMLTRAFYPASLSTQEGGRNLYINYDASRPGINNKVTDYIHLPSNPYFGDIWLKNNRSIDDIGHMIRAIVHLQDCRNAFDDEAKADLDQMNELYSNWAQDVDANNFIIPTYNAKLEPVLVKNGVGDYNSYKIVGMDPNCVGKLAVRFLHSQDPKDLNCGMGISFLEKMGSRFLKNDAIEILRSHHVAAIAMADLRSQNAIATDLRQGLAERMDRDLQVARNNSLSPEFNIQDIPTFFIHAHNVGVPMTSEEIRFVYERLHTAYLGMRAPVHYNTFHLFDSSVPNGEYSYNPPDDGLFFRALGPMIGSCTSEFRNTNGRQLLDCDRLKAAF